MVRVFTFFILVFMLTLDISFAQTQFSNQSEHFFNNPCKHFTDFDSVSSQYFNGSQNRHHFPFSKRIQFPYKAYADDQEYIPVFTNPQTSMLSEGVEEEWVSHFASGLAPSTDGGVDIVTDSLGNIYITGYSTAIYGSDYFTAKYDPYGVMQWYVRYDGGADDYPSDIEIDRQGYVYVTGSSSGDFATVKYDIAGVEQWVARYNGPENSRDYANAIAIDNQGNIYITGYSEGSSLENNFDYATIKYNTAGVQQWVARYEGPVNNANAIALDGYGNVFVTGARRDSVTHFDYATIKYNAAGSEQWVTLYNGPQGNGSDAAYDLAVDSQGNVYVTGSSSSQSTDADYATVKYNAEGVQQWIARYRGQGLSTDRAKALKLDDQGNVYITGRSSDPVTSWDYATVKYNAAGIEQWVARYAGPGQISDGANSLDLDSQGNVIVTGSSYGYMSSSEYATVKYDSMGVEQWVARYISPGEGGNDDEPSALTVDNQGNIFIIGTSLDLGPDTDIITIKYDSLGAEHWVERYNGPGNSTDAANALTIDSQGNIYVTGSSLNSGTDKDFATVKYNASGLEQWVVRYNGLGNFDDVPNAITVDILGNIYVTGISYGLGTSYDYATVKYNASGAEQWVARYNGPGNSFDSAVAISVDSEGNVYVTGVSDGLGTDDDYATVKYDVGGMETWVVRYNGPGNGADEAVALSVDTLGNVYVTGTSYGAGTDNDYATAKYNTYGVEQWIARYNDPGNGDDSASDIALDGMGNIFVTGTSFVSETYDDYATVKYDTDGVEQWVARYDGPGNGIDRANALTLDKQGNVLVTGNSFRSFYDFDYGTVKYDAAGVEQWVAYYNGDSNDDPSDIKTDEYGNVYVTGGSGFSSPGGATFSYATVMYNNMGSEQWVALYKGPGFWNDASSLALDDNENVYVTGLTSNWNWSIFTTIKYENTVNGLGQKLFESPINYKIKQNYPNPFNPRTTIEFSIPKVEFVTLKIYNLLGQEVSTVVLEKLTAGNYKYNWDAGSLASGVYLYKIQAGEFQQIKKMVLIK